MDFQRSKPRASEALKELDTSQLPTKADIESVRQEIRDLKISLIQWMVSIQLGYGALIIAAVAVLLANL